MIISRSKLTKELSEIEKMRKSSRISPREEDIILTPLGESLYHWRGVIKGPPDSAYSEGHFELDIQIPEEYPISPPKVKFLSKVFHPNVHFKTGEICLDILKPEHWTPAWTLESLCRALINLLQDPNADSPLNCDAGTIYLL